MDIGNRIIVIGCPGSGKSFFSKQLYEIIRIPLYHLDNIWWKADRTNITRDEFDERLSAILKEEKWIIDGNYSRTYEIRFKYCDTVIFLDYSKEQCLEGITQRVGTIRGDIPWVEHEVDPELLNMVNNFHANERIKIINLMNRYPEKTYFIFSTREEGNRFLETLREGETQ